MTRDTAHTTNLPAGYYDRGAELTEAELLRRLNEQDAAIVELRAKEESIWSACVAQEDEIALLREQLGQAHEHVGALVAACDTAGTLIELHDPNADALLQIELTATAARAWLRRAAE